MLVTIHELRIMMVRRAMAAVYHLPLRNSDPFTDMGVHHDYDRCQ